MKFKEVYGNGKGDYSLGPFFMSDIRKMGNIIADERHDLSRDDGIKDYRVYITSRVRSQDTIFFACRRVKKVVAYSSFDPISYGGIALIHCITKPNIEPGDFEALVQLQIKYGFEEMELTKITGTPTLDNKPAVGILEKLGFEQEGILKRHRIIDGKAYDVSIQSLWKEG